MAGSVLSPDQVRKINAAYPLLVNHISSLLEKDHTGTGLMRVHLQVESFDSDEMFRIFKELSFISPREKLALVRAAIYEVMVVSPDLFVSPEVPVTVPTDAAGSPVRAEAPKAAVFTPPQFNLNVNTAEAFHGKAPVDTPPPAPKVTSTQTPHVSKVAESLQKGAEEQKLQQEKLEAEVEIVRATEATKLFEASAPQPIEE